MYVIPSNRIFKQLIHVFQILRKFLTVMANRAPYLTHLHIIGTFYSWWEVVQQTGPIDGQAIHVLHGVAAGCLNGLPGWMEVKVSSPEDIRFIRFIRRKAEMVLPQNFDPSVWLSTREEYGIEIKGWIHGSSDFPSQ